MRVKVRCTEGDSAKWKAALLIATLRKDCKVHCGTDTRKLLRRTGCARGGAVRTPTAKKACAGRSARSIRARRAGSRERVFVSDDEGPAHDETLCGLVTTPSRRGRTVAPRAVMAARTATHVKWATLPGRRRPRSAAGRRGRSHLRSPRRRRPRRILDWPWRLAPPPPFASSGRSPAHRRRSSFRFPYDHRTLRPPSPATLTLNASVPPAPISVPHAFWDVERGAGSSRRAVGPLVI